MMFARHEYGWERQGPSLYGLGDACSDCILDPQRADCTAECGGGGGGATPYGPPAPGTPAYEAMTPTVQPCPAGMRSFASVDIPIGWDAGCYYPQDVASGLATQAASEAPAPAPSAYSAPLAPGASPNCITTPQGQLCGAQAAQWQQQHPTTPYCPGGYTLTSGGCLPPGAPAAQKPVPAQNAQGQRCAPVLFGLFSTCAGSDTQAKTKARNINVAAAIGGGLLLAGIVWKLA